MAQVFNFVSKKMMDTKTANLILVVGGTGTQGGNVARELLKYGHRVRILSRNPASPAAQQLATLGAEIVKGDMGDLSSLLPVMKDVTAIFSAQYADPTDPTIEFRNAGNMVQAAREMGINQIVHTSVGGTNNFPRWDKYPMLTALWDYKYKVEEFIRNGGFQYWTILHPCWFMENFAQPLDGLMTPGLKAGNIFGVMHPDSPVKLNSGEDTAKFARAAFENPERFHSKDVNIAAEELSWTQMADLLSNALNKKVTYDQVTREQAITRGLLEGTVNATEWIEETRFGFDLNETLQYGIPLKSFKQWLHENSHRIVIN
jgi:uncharacterized protein YbjT (DUF2867 family)